jgi:hypothetical protein
LAEAVRPMPANARAILIEASATHIAGWTSFYPILI